MTCSLIVMVVSSFTQKEMSVYTDPQLLIQVSKKYTFPLTQKLFDAIDIDETKVLKCRRDAGQIKIAIQYKADLSTCDYDKYIFHLLEHVAGL